MAFPSSTSVTNIKKNVSSAKFHLRMMKRELFFVLCELIVPACMRRRYGGENVDCSVANK